MVKNDVVKKTVYDELVAKVNNIDTSGFVLKTMCDTDKWELENKIPDTWGLVKKNYNTKIVEIEGKIPDVSNLATKTELTTSENKIPSVSSLVNKTFYNTKITEIENMLNDHNHDKYITTSVFNTLAADVFNARLAHLPKTAFDAKLSSLNRKITSNESKRLLIENELKKLKTFDASYFIGKSYFVDNDCAENYSVFQPTHRYFKVNGNNKYIEYVLSWRSKGLSDESIKAIATSDNSRNPSLSYYDSKIKVKFAGSCLKQPKLTYTHGKVVNIYIVYELDASGSNDSDPTLKNCSFGAVTLTKNADIDKYRYSGYGIAFDRKRAFSFPGTGFGQNVLTFGADMSSSAHIDNRKKDILVLGKEPTQGLEHTLTAEKMYSIEFYSYKKEILLKLALQWSK